MLNAQEKVWVLIARSTDAQLYESPNLSLHELMPIHEFVNPDGRLHNKELRDTNIGRVHSKNYPRTKGLRPKLTSHELILITFARTLTEYIETGRMNHSFDKLMIVAAPKLLGIIRGLLSKQTKTMLWNEIPKEVNFENKRDLIEYIHQSP